MERAGSVHGGKEVQNEKGKKERIREEKRGSKSERENRASSFSRSWQNKRAPKRLGVPEATRFGRELTLFLPGAGAGRGGLAPERLRCELFQPGVYSAGAAAVAARPACVCLCARSIACTGWEWRSPRRGWGRHASQRGIGALASELRGVPSGGLPPERPESPCSGRAELPTSLPTPATRLCGSARRGTWQTLPGRREQRGPPSGSPEGRLLPPLGQPPRFAPAPSPSGQPACSSMRGARR